MEWQLNATDNSYLDGQKAIIQLVGAMSRACTEYEISVSVEHRSLLMS